LAFFAAGFFSATFFSLGAAFYFGSDFSLASTFLGSSAGKASGLKLQSNK
jgi:hypothetical protein